MDQTKLAKLLIEEVAEHAAKELVRKAGDRLLVFEGVRHGTLGLVVKASALHHRKREPGSGKFRRVEPRDLAHGETIRDAEGFVHSGAILPALRALLSGNPKDGITS